MENKKRTVIIGLSGGIDSAVAAYDLKNEGYDVVGVTFDFFNDEKIMKNAIDIGIRLGIEHRIINLQDQFKKKIIQPFINGYKIGETPNPCILCNQAFKFNILSEIATEYENARIATGHYVETQKNRLGYHLLASENQHKDQSYFLYHLNQRMLKQLIFPLQQYHSKDNVRESINEILPDISKGSESQGICFVGTGNHSIFLKNEIYGSGPVPQGPIIHTNGKVLGRHHGIHKFTLGQTRGMGINHESDLFVLKIIPEKNTIIVGPEELLFKKKIAVKNLYINPTVEVLDKEIEFKVCRWGPCYKGTLEVLDHQKGMMYSHVAVRAPAPGQSIVLYNGRDVLGGGIIENSVDDE
jgi:tRNA-specific 2-thiouridylase